LSPDARVHYPHIKHPTHQPHPPAHSQQATKEAQNKQTPPPGKTPRGVCGPDSSGPNSVPKPTTHPPHPQVPHPPPPPPKGEQQLRIVLRRHDAHGAGVRR